MTSKTLASLRENNLKLKSTADALTEDIGKYHEELSALQQTISRCDIELSLIHDAFALRFGNMSESQRNQALEAMSNLSEVESLETVLQREQSQVKWLQNEVQRLSGLVPTKMLEDVDIQKLEGKRQQLYEKFEALKAKNAKKEKVIRNEENKIQKTLNEIQKLQEELAIKDEENKENLEMAEQVDQLVQDNKQLTEEFKKENQLMHDIQDNLSKANNEIQEIQNYIDENGTAITESAQFQDHLVDVFGEVDKSNQPLKDLKSKYDAFSTMAVPLQDNLSNQVDEITQLIEKVKVLIC